MPICVCNVPVRTVPGNDWLKLQCRSCRSCFCFSCGMAPHFPALCREAMEWNRFDIPAVRECQRQWNLLNQQLDSVRFLENSYVDHGDAASFALFYLHHPDLQYAIMEMEAIIEIRRWLSVIFRWYPHVAEFLSVGYERLKNAFSTLLASFPLPGAAQAGDLSPMRLEASLAMSRLLADLYRVRVANTPLELINASVVPFYAIQNPQLQVVPPITLFDFDAPLGEKMDITYMALLQLEKILWQFTYHQRHH